MSFLRARIWIVVALGVALPCVQGPAQTAKRKAHKVIIYPSANESIDQLKSQGVTNVDNYGSYWIVEADDSQLDSLKKTRRDRIKVGDYLNRIELRSMAVDTTEKEPAVPADLREVPLPGKRLRLIQFKGPVLPEWLEKVQGAGNVKIITYIPNNAYLVWLDEKAEAKLNALMAPAGPIQWIGTYHPYYKLGQFKQESAGEPVEVQIAVVDGPEADQTIAFISAYGLEPLAGMRQTLNRRVFRLKVMPAVLPQIAQVPDVVWVEPVMPMVPMDEKQDLISASVTNALPGHGPFPGVGQYLDFLTNIVGFSTNSFDYPIVDVADTGLDNYTYGAFTTNINGFLTSHPAFLEFGVGPSRIAYLLNHFDVPNNCTPFDNPCTSCGPYDGIAHGTLVSSILLGYDDQDDEPRQCIQRLTTILLFGTNVVCPGGGLLTTNISFPTLPFPTSTNFNLVTCPGAGSTNLQIFLPSVVVFTNTFTVAHRDSDEFQHWLGVSPFGRFGSSKIFSDSGVFFRGCPNDFTCPAFDIGTVIDNIEDMVACAYLSRARIQNNSWGEGLNPSGNGGIYDPDSLSYDVLVRDALPTGATNTPGPSALNQEFTQIFSSGNANGVTPNSFGDIVVTPPATAKNVITVGASENVRPLNGCAPFASDSDNSFDMSFFSSFGPTEDGRFKPEIVAPGSSIHGALSQASFSAFFSTLTCANPFDPFNTNIFVAVSQSLDTCGNSTSFAAPAVSGATQLFWWYYLNRLGSTNPPSPAMAKAYLCNSARYLTGLGAQDDLPSNAQGMGELDLARMFDGVPRVLRDEQPFFSFLEIPPGPTNYTPQLFSRVGQSYELSGQVADATKPFRVTLVWTDAPGDPARFKQLSNDLDLQVSIGGQTYRGNVFIGPNSIPGGSFDNINNMESVFLPPGQTGTWNIVVRAFDINSDGVPNKGNATDQDMALVVYNSINPSDAPNLSTNDSCETAIDIVKFPYQSTFQLKPPTFHNTHISPSAGRGGVEAFWRIPRPTQGTGFTIGTLGSNFPTLLSIWRVESGAGFGVRRAECGALVELLSINSGGGLGSTLTFIADGTSAYYIVAEGVNGATGTLKLNVAASLPPIGLNPTGLDFGPLLVGQTSAVLSVTLSNGSPEIIDVNSVQIGGTDAGDFVIFSDLCTGSTLAQGGTCQIFVQFIPTAVGLRSAELQVFDSATGSPHTIPLSGIGLTPAPIICASAGSLTFPNTATGASSAALTATITNCGVAALFVTNAVLTGAAAGDYVITSDACSGNSIAPASSCGIGVAFAPTTTGTRVATLRVNSDATNSPTQIILTGVGELPTPRICFSPTSVNFGNTSLDSTSSVHSIIVSNCGTAPLVITAVSITGTNAGQFILASQNCIGGGIPIGGTCTVGVQFAATVFGPANATLQVTDNAAGSPHTVPLTALGAGSQPDAAIGKTIKEKKLVGNNVINSTGVDQEFVQKVKRGAKKGRRFFMRLKNVGTSADQFKVEGDGDSAGFTVKYFLGAADTTDISAAVESGAHASATLAPAAITGDATMIRIEVLVDKAVPKGTVKTFTISFTSVANPGKVDVVKATVIAK